MAAPNTNFAPTTPTRPKEGQDKIIDYYNTKWNLCLPKPSSLPRSPSKVSDKHLPTRERCLMRIKYLYYQKNGDEILERIKHNFEEWVKPRVSNWVCKEGQEEGTIPSQPPGRSLVLKDAMIKTRNLTQHERDVMLNNLFRLLNDEAYLIKESVAKSPAVKTTTSVGHRPPHNVGERSTASDTGSFVKPNSPKRKREAIEHEGAHGMSGEQASGNGPSPATIGKRRPQGEEVFVTAPNSPSSIPDCPSPRSEHLLLPQSYLPTDASINQNRTPIKKRQSTIPAAWVRQKPAADGLTDGDDKGPNIDVFDGPSKQSSNHRTSAPVFPTEDIALPLPRQNPSIPSGAKLETSFSTTMSGDSGAPEVFSPKDNSFQSDASEVSEDDFSTQGVTQLYNDHELDDLLQKVELGVGIATNHMPGPVVGTAPCPFRPSDPRSTSRLAPLRCRYEISRIVTRLPCDQGREECFKDESWFDHASYQDFWSAVQTASHTRLRLEKSDPKAWSHAITSFQDEHTRSVILSGSLEWVNTSEILRLRLNPLRLERSCRLHRRFGADRFLVVTLPSLMKRLPPYLQSHQSHLHLSVTNWLSTSTHWILDRQWRVFFIEEDKRKTTNNLNLGGFKVHLFAVSGIDFVERSNSDLPARGQPAESRTPMTLLELSNWHIPLLDNVKSTDCKLFQRWSLGLSKTSPTVLLHPSEFVRLTDLPGKPVMNDGCARLSYSLACDISERLGLGRSRVPSAFQARVAGAKGMWMVEKVGNSVAYDEGERGYWIEIADSQMKVWPHPKDMHDAEDEKLIFEVLDYSKPDLKPASLNHQLLRILHARGVPRDSFAERLHVDTDSFYKDLSESMRNRLDCRKFLQKLAPVLQTSQGPVSNGGWPAKYAQQSILLLDSGFDPMNCSILVDCLRRCLRIEMDRRVEKLQIKIPLSTFIYCVSDPYGILEEDEIHLTFSKPWEEPDFSDGDLDGFNVLLGRLPAHLGSDIQSRKAVYKERLRHFKDVVVFSSKGDVPLASMLSGGDYDGDKVWVCWDQNLVQHFKNMDPPRETMSVFDYGLMSEARPISEVLPSLKYAPIPTQTELDDFYQHCFRFNTYPSFLGIATVELESIGYDTGNISCPEATQLSLLVSHLVDAPKQGLLLTETAWRSLRSKVSPRSRPRPAYKDGKASAHQTRPSSVIDFLKFEVAIPEKDRILEKFHENWPCESIRDAHLSQLWRDTRARAEREAGENLPELKQVLDLLKREVIYIYRQWSRHFSGDVDKMDPSVFSAIVDSTVEQVKLVQPVESTHELAIRWEEERGMRNSHWDLLRASLIHHEYYSSRFPFYTVCEGLCRMKADNEDKPSRTVVGEVYQLLQIPSRIGRKQEETAPDYENIENDDGEI